MLFCTISTARPQKQIWTNIASDSESCTKAEKAETLTFQRNEFLELLKNAIFLRLEFQKKFQVGQQTKIKSPHQCHQFHTYVKKRFIQLSEETFSWFIWMNKK